MSAEQVVLVHGIWMHGSVMAGLKYRLENEQGLSAQLFSYPSVRGSVDENAALLADYIGDLGRGPVHLVGHSLGGVLILYMLAHYEGLPPGRVVCLGSPLCGSRAAAELRRQSWGSAVLGNTIGACVLDDSAAHWAAAVAAEREVGVIAGTRAMGVGRWITTFDGASDGTVAVAETRLPNAADHIEILVSHFGMMLSREVAKQTAAFLKDGRFSRD